MGFNGDTRPRHAVAVSEALRLRPRLRSSDINNRILDSNISSCGSNGAAAAAAQNLSARAGSVMKFVIISTDVEKFAPGTSW